MAGALEPTSGNLFETIVEALTGGIGKLIETISPAGARALEQRLYYDITRLDVLAFGLLVLAVWAVNRFLVRFLTRKVLDRTAARDPNSWPILALNAARRPIYFALWVCGVYLAVLPLAGGLPAFPPHPLRTLAERLFDTGLFVAVVWLFFRSIRIVESRMKVWAAGTASRLDDFLVPLATRTLQVVVPLIAVILALPLLGLPLEYDSVIRRLVTLLIVGTVAWILVQAVLIFEKAVIARYDITQADNLRARAVITQVYVLKRTALVVIGVFTVASVLMTFEEVRRVGTSILASAGLAGIIIGFAAQRALANLFAGIQIAFTQPIRLDDVVIVENEWGRIEEITLTYVVVKIWDMRRLVVPISYFIEKPFQNWTRTTADILGSVFLFVDYTLPLDELRQEIKRIVEAAPDWDRKFWNLQVTDCTDRTMQIRVLATATDASRAWNLRCEIREKLIRYIQEKYPESLPRTRARLEDLDKLKLDRPEPPP